MHHFLLLLVTPFMSLLSFIIGLGILVFPCFLPESSVTSVYWILSRDTLFFVSLNFSGRPSTVLYGFLGSKAYTGSSPILNFNITSALCHHCFLPIVVSSSHSALWSSWGPFAHFLIVSLSLTSLRPHDRSVTLNWLYHHHSSLAFSSISPAQQTLLA